MIKKKSVIIFGTNQISLLAKFYLENDSEYKPIAFCVDSKHFSKDKIDGLPVIIFEKIESFYTPNKYSFFVPLYENLLREEKCKQVKNKGYNIISYVSSKSYCFSKVGENCFIMESNVIQPFVEIGNNIIMWSGNHIGHNSKIEDNVFISSHVVVSGNCNIKKYSWLGVNSSIKDNTIIAEGTFVCMGSVVTKDTKPWGKYFGNPAKIKKTIKK